MKKIEKELTVTRYVAFDGTEFETEQECQNYEGSAFGLLMQQLDAAIVFEDGSHGFKSYFLVPHTRHDIFILGQILQMTGKNTACGDAVDHPITLSVWIECNVVTDAYITKIDEAVEKISGGAYTVVSNMPIKEKKSSTTELMKGSKK